MHPLLDGPRVFVSREQHFGPRGELLEWGQLRAFDRVTGTLLWNSKINTAHNAAIAGKVVAAVWGGLPMFDRVSGTPTHIFRYGDTSLSSNVVSDGERFFVASHNGHILAIDPATGTVLWDHMLDDTANVGVYGLATERSDLAVLFLARSSGGAPPEWVALSVLDPATGLQRWRTTLHGATIARAMTGGAPVIAHGQVIVQTGQYELLSFDLDSGNLRWRQDLRQRYLGDSRGLTACDDMVIGVTDDLAIAAVNIATGEIRWRRTDLGSGSLKQLECSYGTVLVQGSLLQVIDARTGSTRASYPIRWPQDPRREFMIAGVTRDAESLYISTTFGWAKIRAP